jgi:hypothetical protein
LVAVSALGLGVLARFKGLGAAPLAVDEYFILRSTQNLLRHGWPAFDCGGIYSRGLLLQYLSAPLILLHIAPPVAPRLVSAVSSLLALPAAFHIGCRVQSRSLGLLAVVILALSVWETEMARFGRMYAPFQAVFLWYLVCFLKRTVDGDLRADSWMIALTVVGTLLWEGGALLAVTNFLPVFLQRRSARLSRSEWLGLAKFVPILAAAYWFVTTDFRMLGGTPALPVDYDASAVDSLGELRSGTLSLRPALAAHQAWWVWSLVPLAASVLALRSLWRQRRVNLATAGLIGALLAALAHQFLISAILLLMVALFRFGGREQLASPAARGVYLAIGVWALFWLSLIVASWERPPGVPLWKALLSSVFPLVSTPDVIDQVLRPWGGAVPMLGMGLLVLVAAACYRTLRSDEHGVSAQRAVLAAFFCLLLAACATHTPRHETRYIFFLYPVAVILALATLTGWMETIAARTGVTGVLLAPAVSLGAFMLTEDFQPRHLLEIDRDATIFKSDLRPAQRAHLVVREDTPALAQWLGGHAARPGDVVVSAYQSLDYYDPKVDFFYVDRSDFNFEAYACRLGTTERWSNRPLLQSVPALAAVIAASPATYVVTYKTRLTPLLEQLAPYHPSVQWQHGDLAVVAFARAPAPQVAHSL